VNSTFVAAVRDCILLILRYPDAGASRNLILTALKLCSLKIAHAKKSMLMSVRLGMALLLKKQHRSSSTFRFVTAAIWTAQIHWKLLAKSKDPKHLLYRCKNPKCLIVA
jgi:hypothetical protein